MNVHFAGAILSVTAVAGVLGICLVHNPVGKVEAANNPGQPGYFADSVQPIFQANCYRCHGAGNHRGGLNMDSREALLSGGHHGPAIVPGQPAQSLLVKLMRHEGPPDDPMNMPPAPKQKVSDADIAVVETWIKAGAVMPSAGSKTPEQK